ncbi:MAG: peptidase S41, partial [Deltaproteobacteria bacterium]|nr:peptidase S41 [Deltaproteobacteria bacterium]
GLRLTTAKYYTANGTSIQATGIIPDIEVLPGEIKELAEREHFREKDLRNHFDQDTSQKDSSPLKTEPSALDREDYQLMRALDLLKGWQILSGKQAA